MNVMEARLVYRATRRKIPALPVNSPERVARAVARGIIKYAQQETTWCIPLNRKNYALGRILIAIGGRNTCLVDPVVFYRTALLAGACGAILVHSHPSGDPRPSTRDIDLTRQLVKAGEAIDIQLVDHVIVSSAHRVSNPPYFSFRHQSPEIFGGAPLPAVPQSGKVSRELAQAIREVVVETLKLPSRPRNASGSRSS